MKYSADGQIQLILIVITKVLSKYVAQHVALGVWVGDDAQLPPFYFIICKFCEVVSIFDFDKVT